MTPQESVAHESPRKEYVLRVRDPSGEQMNDCYFTATSDEEAATVAADHLGIGELSEAHFPAKGYFSLSRKGGSQLFPHPAS